MGPNQVARENRDEMIAQGDREIGSGEVLGDVSRSATRQCTGFADPRIAFGD